MQTQGDRTQGDTALEEDCCRCCGDEFGQGEYAPSRVDPELCHYCYTNGVDLTDLGD